MFTKKITSLTKLIVLATIFFAAQLSAHKDSTQNNYETNNVTQEETTKNNDTLDQQEEKIVRVYIDMVGDLFHAGHVAALKKARAFGDYLIVGVCSDETCASYKRWPILTMEERIGEIESCKYVDEIIPDSPEETTKEWIEKYKIDIVVHGDDFDEESLRKYYGDPIDMGIFRTIPYTKGISTSEIIHRILSRDPEEFIKKEKTGEE